jgi:YebC/PmpR family DNA-binding regulatory protein
MSGHSKWASIKHKKGAADAKRGRIFTRLVKEIIIAARQGGGIAENNPRLRTAIMTARGNNMPRENIEKAIKRGTGELEGVSYDEITYEGYGQNGVAIIVEVLTDNKNRTVADVRHVFSKYGGNLAESGAVSWNFEQKGLVKIPAEGISEDDIMMQALDAGAEDVELDDENWAIYTPVSDFTKVMNDLEKQGLKIVSAELTRVPKTTVNADSVAEKLLRLIEMLEDLDDVQKVYANFELSDEVLETLA